MLEQDRRLECVTLRLLRVELAWDAEHAQDVAIVSDHGMGLKLEAVLSADLLEGFSCITFVTIA